MIRCERCGKKILYPVQNQKFCGSYEEKVGCRYIKARERVRNWSKRNPDYLKTWIEKNPNYFLKKYQLRKCNHEIPDHA